MTVRLDVVEGYVRSVIHLPKVKSEDYDNYTTLLELFRNSLTQKEMKVAVKFLEEERL